MTISNGEKKSSAQVIIVGAGPVGMLTALRLGQAGVDTLVIEGHETLLPTTRAVVYMPVVIPVLRELGILDTVLKHGYLDKHGVTWRDIDGKAQANLPLASPDPNELDGIIQLGQSQMNSLVQEELKKYPNVQIRFGLKLIALSNDPSSSTVTLTAHDTLSSSTNNKEDTQTTLTANFVLGTDGANSTTRQLLSIPFTGQKFDSMRLVGIDVLYDFIQNESFTPLNFIVHPTDWAVVTFTGQNGAGQPCDPTTPLPQTTPSSPPTTSTPLWRVAYPESPSLPTDQTSIHERATAQMSKYARSGAPWTLLRAEPYHISQRAAEVAIIHRVALAGDALHCNNPIGGLGLTGGILDAFCYGNALARVFRDGEDIALLTQCATARLRIWREITDGLSRGNLERLYGEEGGEVGRARDRLFAGLNGEGRSVVADNVRKGFVSMLGDDFSGGGVVFG